MEGVESRISLLNIYRIKTSIQKMVLDFSRAISIRFSLIVECISIVSIFSSTQFIRGTNLKKYFWC